MRVVKPLKLALLHRTFEDGARTILTVTAMAFFPFGNRRKIFSEIPMWKIAAEVLGGETPLDAAMPKTRGEVIVLGDACAGAQPKPVVPVRVQMSNVEKRLVVFGDRQWGLTGPSEPVPFTRMPINWSRAFGGEGCEHNPAGRGFRKIEVDAREIWPLPNVEDPKDLVASSGDKPMPAGFAPMDQTVPLRTRHHGTYDAKWQKTRFPWFPEDFGWEFFNVAPPDQRIKDFFVGDETFSVDGMHPAKARVEGSLPDLRARLFVIKKEAPEQLIELKNHIDTVILLPNIERGIVIFRGSTQVNEDDAHDVSHVVGAFEDTRESPRPASHYLGVVRNREDREKAALFAMRDRDLLPDWPKDVSEPEDTWSDHPALVKNENLMRGYLERQAKIVVEATKTEMAAAGLDTSKVEFSSPTDHAPDDVDDLPDFFEKNLAKAGAAIDEAEQKRAELIDQVRAEMAEAGLDFDGLREKAKREGGGPPRYALAESQVARLVQIAAMQRLSGADASALEAQAADPAIREAFGKAEVGAYQGYRRFTHYFPEAAPIEADESQLLRGRVQAALDSHTSMKGWDLTGADLSGLDFTAADLEEVLLEGANLAGSRFDSANLKNATLARANVGVASFKGANLEGANLSLTKLSGVVLDDAKLDEGTAFYKAELAFASMKRVRLTGNVLLFSVGGAVDLSEAIIDTANMFEVDLRGAKLASASITITSFLRCKLDGADLSSAKLRQAGFVECSAVGLNLAGASLERVVFALGSDLEGASMVRTRVKHSSFRACSLKKADLTDAVVDECDFGESILEGAKLRRTSAKKSLFMRADLRFSDLRGSDLSEALFEKAQVHGADMRGVNFFRADMAKVRGDKGTQMADAYLVQVRSVPETGEKAGEA